MVRNIFVYMLLFVVLLVFIFLSPEITEIKQFYYRIAVGLLAAGIASYIPGFIEIKIDWVHFVLSAGGAIAIFILIYFYNPAKIETFKPLSQLQGKYRYSVRSLNGPFPYKGEMHGGTATINTIVTSFGYALSVNGNTEWMEIDGQRVPAKPPFTWHSNGANFTGPDQIMYEYSVTDVGRQYRGLSSFIIERDTNGHITELRGTFVRVDSPHVNGIIVMNKIGQ